MLFFRSSNLRLALVVYYGHCRPSSEVSSLLFAKSRSYYDPFGPLLMQSERLLRQVRDFGL